jgi:hypothetical protein
VSRWLRVRSFPEGRASPRLGGGWQVIPCSTHSPEPGPRPGSGLRSVLAHPANRRRRPSAAADFVCLGSCLPSGGCRVGSPVPCPRLAVSGPVCPVSRTRPASLAPGGPGPPRLPRPATAMFHRCRWGSSDVPSMPFAGGRGRAGGAAGEGNGTSGHEMRNCGRGKPSLPQH